MTNNTSRHALEPLGRALSALEDVHLDDLERLRPTDLLTLEKLAAELTVEASILASSIARARGTAS